MKVYHGKSVFGGIAIGKTAVYQKSEQQVKRVKTEDSDGEWARYQAAREASIEQLGELYDKACREVGETNAAIFEIHQMMLEDDDYNESVENIIRTQQVNAEYAVAATGDNFSQMFAAMDDDYMRGRAADVKDISERVLNNLSGAGKTGVTTDEPVIILADDLAPSETVQLDKDKVLSFVTVHGSTNSHTAILARTMAIPALIGTDIPLDETTDGVPAVVDGSDGTIYVDPDEETMALMQEKKRADEEKKALTEELSGIITSIAAEGEIESMIKAKGFIDCVAFLDGDKANIAVKTQSDALTKSEVAQIRDIVMSKSSISAQNITVVEVQ